MVLVLKLVGVATVPLKVTVVLPWFATKLVPVIVIESPTEPLDLLRLDIVGLELCPAAKLNGDIAISGGRQSHTAFSEASVDV
jgi:hypothetical protein